VFTDVDLAIDRGSRVVVLGLNGAGKTTLLRVLAGIDTPDTGSVVPGHGLKLGYYAQSTRRSTPPARCWRTCTARRHS
jgi:ATPase subunit of ABC transporter with duplicated ATPase domains